MIFEASIGDEIESFLEKAFEYLVDSNVFLRSIILSIFHFGDSDQSKPATLLGNCSFLAASKISSAVVRNLP